MNRSVLRKLCPLNRLRAVRQDASRRGLRIAHCHGCFDLVHPGHLRYLQFARAQADVLVVSITSDDAIEKDDGMRPYVPQELRAENLASLEFVDHVVVAEDPTAEPVIEALRPDVYVKGHEYESSSHPGFLSEKQKVESLGGQVIFSSDDVVLSSSAILDDRQAALSAEGLSQPHRLTSPCRRWGVTAGSVRQLTESWRGKRVLIVGDAIADHYAFCDAPTPTDEAPVLAVRPRSEAHYLGGAAIMAAHIKQLGGRPHLITSVGDDPASAQLLDRLKQLQVEVTALPLRRELPVKLRYLVQSQKVFKVSRGDPQPLDSSAQRKLLAVASDLVGELDAAIVTDFGYGIVSEALLGQLMPLLRPHVRTITGDVSGVRRSLLAMQDADLITPNERELRGVVGDFENNLPTLAMSVMRQLRLPSMAITLAQKGCLLFRPREEEPSRRYHARLRCDYMPTLAAHAVDPLGAGDAFLAAATLALCSGAPLPQAGYVGSCAAAVSVSRMGNEPVSLAQLSSLFDSRPELAPLKLTGNDARALAC